MSEGVSDINSYNLILMYLLIVIKCYNRFTDHLEDPSILNIRGVLSLY